MKLKNVTLLIISMCLCGAPLVANEVVNAVVNEAIKAPQFVPTEEQIAEKTDVQLRELVSADTKAILVIPGSTQIVWVNGSLVLYAYYNNCYSATVISGYNTGLQGFYSYNGFFLTGSPLISWVNYNGVMMMKHHYAGCDVYTNENGQSVVFY